MFAISSSISIGSYYTSGADFPSDIPGNIANWRVSSTDASTSSAAAKTMGSRTFNGTTEYFSLADNAAVSLGADTAFTVSAWFNAASLPGANTSETILSKASVKADDTAVEYKLDIVDTAGTVTFRGTVGDGSSSQTVDSTENPVVSTWYFVQFKHDPTADEISIRVDNGTAVTASWSDGTQDTSGSLVVGAESDGASAATTQFIAADVAGLAFHKKVTTAVEDTYYFNGGLGRSASEVNSHASLGSFGSGTSVDFWPLNEASGNAISVTGNNNLTDNNTVGSADGPATINAADSAGDNTGTLTNFTAGGGAYTTDTAHGTFDPTAEDTSSNNNHGALNHDHLEVWDKSGNGNVGTMTGFADGLTPRITSLKTGASGKALRFDGVDDVVDTGAKPTQGLGSLSISVWVRFADTGVKYDNILTDYIRFAPWLPYPGNTTMSVDIRKGNDSTDNDIDFILRTSSDVSATYSGDISGWLHIVGTYDGANIKLYVNSVLADTQAQTGSTEISSSNLELGRIQLPTPARHLDGDLADLRIFSFALTPEQITYLFEDYTGEPSGPLNDPGKPDLLWYDFEDDPRQSDTAWAIEDESTNNNFAMPVGIGVANPLSTDVPAVLKDESSNENVGRFVGFSEADPRSTKTVALTLDSSTNSNHLSMIGFSGVLDPTVPAVDGATGTGVHFDGTDDYLSAGDQGELDFGSSDFSIACWFKTSVSSGNHELVRKGESFRYLLRLDSSGNVILEIDDDTTLKSVTSTGTYDDGSWHFAVGVRDGNTLRLFVDAVAEGTTDITGYGALDDAVAFTIGAESTESNFFSGEMDDIRVYSDALSANEALGLYNLHRNEPIGSGTDPGAANLVGHWKLDKGDTRSIEFDGDDDSVFLGEIASGDSLMLDGSAGGITAWVNRAGTGDTFQRIFDKSDGGGGANGYCFIIGTIADNSNGLGFDIDGTVWDTSSSTFPAANKWVHVAATWAADGEVKFYVDATEVSGSVTSGAKQPIPEATTNARIGSWNHSTGRELNGLLEDIRVYNIQPSADNITYIRNERLGATGGTAPTTSPVAHYKGENLLTASGKSMPFVRDQSQALDAGDAAEWDFGTGDYTVMFWARWTNAASVDMDFLTKDTTAGNTDGIHIYRSTSDLDAITFWNGSSDTNNGSGLNDGMWRHFAFVRSGTGADGVTVYIGGEAQANTATDARDLDNSQPLRIGSAANGNYLDGQMYDVRGYNAALSAANIQSVIDSTFSLTGATDYTTNLIGKYITSQLSNEIARIAADSSSSGNDATIVSKDIGTALSTSVVSGASGSCLVNTLDEYVRLDEHIDDYKSDAYGSIAGWFKTAGTAGDQVLFSASDRGDSNSECTIKLTTAGVIDIIIQDAGSATLELTASTGLDDDAWHHFAFGSSASSNTLYIDGSSVTPTYSTGSASTQAWLSNIADLDTMRIGAKVQSDVLSSHWEGSLDDVRYYSEYQLTAANAEFLYDNFRGVTGGTSAGSTDLTGHWTFDALSAETAGKSVAFNGSDNEVRIESDDTIDQLFTGGGTIEAWIKPYSDGEGDHGRILSKSVVGTSGWEMYVHDELSGTAGIEFFLIWSGTDGNWKTTARDINLGVWNHVVLTYDDGDVANDPTMYVNGVSVSITENTGPPTGTAADDSGEEMYIGNRDAGDRAFDGLIRGARCYTEILSADEVENRYGEGIRLYGGLSAVEPPKGSIAMALEFSESNERSVATLKDGMSLEFDGTDDYIDAGTVTITDALTTASWSAWIFADEVSTADAYLVKWASSQSHFSFQRNGADWRGFIADGVGDAGNNRGDASSVFEIGKWYHVVTVFDGSLAAADRLKLYIDGSEVSLTITGTISTSLTTSTATLEIGRDQNVAGREWDGQLDDVRIYSRVLTASEIYDIYTGADNTTGLVLHHKYDTPANPAGLQGDQINRVLGQDTPPLDANQIVQANRASLAVGANGLVNQSVLEFAGSPESHEISSYLKDTYYIAMALQTGSSAFSADQVALSFSDTASTTKYFAPICIDASGNPFILWSNGGTETRLTATGITLTTSTTYVFEIWSLNGKYYLKVNGTEYALTVDTGSNDGAINFDDGDVTTLGALRTTSVQKYFEGKIAHWTAYNNVPTVADRTLVRNFLGITYGVTIAS